MTPKPYSIVEPEYLHGGNPEHDFNRLGITRRPVLDFSVNINPLGPPAEVLAAWGEMAREITQYPSTCGDAVKRFYQERFALSPDCVLPGNGSIELIYLVPRVLRLRRVALLSPSFHDYYNAANISGSEISYIPLVIDNEFAPLQIKEMERYINDVEAVYIGNPNNPTGTIFNRDILIFLANKYPDKWFFIDEAFSQFVDNFEDITLMKSDYLKSNVLVFHSLTKFYALPGLRIGAVIGNPAVIKRLGTFKEPWSVNSIAERIAGMLAQCREHEELTRRLVRQERHRLFLVFKTIPGIRAFFPKANYFLAQLTAADSFDDFLRHLMSSGIYVRDCRNFKGLENKFFRLAIRKPAENDMLLKAIARFRGRRDA